MRIVLVEDDPGVARSLTRLLKGHGHEVFHCETLRQARLCLGLLSCPEDGPSFTDLDELRVEFVETYGVLRRPMDVVVLDRQVSGEDGWALAPLVRAQGLSRVVLMSGDAPFGSPPHFLKGSDPRLLLDAIEGVSSS